MEGSIAPEDSQIFVDRYSISFSDPIYKINGLTKENVITYFGRSEFYTDSEKAQYEVEEIDGDKLFKIVKYYLHQTEEKGDVKEVAAVYYILNGDIYQCPDLYSLAKYRLVVLAFDVYPSTIASRHSTDRMTSLKNMWISHRLKAT